MNIDSRDKKNTDFIQYNRKNMTSLRLVSKENPYATDIFMFLSQKMDRANCVSCSNKVLQEVVGCSRSSVYRAVKGLKEAGLITVFKQGTSQVYVLNPEVVWSSWNSNKKYCEFDGKVLVSKSENQELSKKLKSFKTLKMS